jgi:Fe2+ transport system protein FeoA
VTDYATALNAWMERLLLLLREAGAGPPSVGVGELEAIVKKGEADVAQADRSLREKLVALGIKPEEALKVEPLPKPSKSLDELLQESEAAVAAKEAELAAKLRAMGIKPEEALKVGPLPKPTKSLDELLQESEAAVAAKEAELAAMLKALGIDPKALAPKPVPPPPMPDDSAAVIRWLTGV